MRMKYYVLFFFVLFLCACTGDENSSSCSVSVQLLSPTDEVTLPFEEMEVVLTNKDQGTVYTSSCGSDGVALFNVEYGYYTVAVHYQSASGIIFSGRLESLSLLPEQGEEVAQMLIDESVVVVLGGNAFKRKHDDISTSSSTARSTGVVSSGSNDLDANSEAVAAVRQPRQE